MGLCSIDGCDEPTTAHGAHGWCPSHYMRWYRHGDIAPDEPIRTRVQGSTLHDRLDRYADMTGGDDACWSWKSYMSQDGYGRVWNGRHSVEAYRATYELFVGPVPQGMELDHLCRNRACVNPSHLEPVTHAENLRRGASSRRGTRQN